MWGAPLLLVALAAPVLAGGCGGADVDEDRAEALLELGRTDLGGGRQAPAAGVSTRIVNPPRPLDMAAYPQEHGSAAFRTYMNRCGACHAAPDPTLKTAAAWAPLITRMEGHIASAGLLPPRQEEKDSIQAFLGRHALKPDNGGS